jgi:hypothetical protein
MFTNLANGQLAAKVRGEMGEGHQVDGCPQPNIAQRIVLKTKPKGTKTECLFANGTSILVSNFLASFFRAGEELLFPLGLEEAEAGTQICSRSTSREERRRDFFQAEIGYATQPRKDQRDNLFAAAEVCGPNLGISAIHLRCETLILEVLCIVLWSKGIEG